ncbi:hypothetical protein SO694_00049056 [Aureococcus anophagefferens]|uniref:EF-hand domain-containing protein n=1 Tax=Aureococcus anophagefferens TaxID=44056 RepID=A0ABR1G809_AURAN
MIRNAWHIAGGEGWCANTANLRVLVTHADGSQSVEAVEDDLGLSLPKDAYEVLKRLRAQGVDAVSVTSAASATFGDGKANGAPCAARAAARAAAPRPPRPPRPPRRPRGRATLFAYLDDDGSGDVDYEEFLAHLRGPMSQRRKDLVARAFQVLDADGSGVIECQDVVDKFDASQHPDVKQGKKSPDEVTRAEFDHYYHNVSCSIDDDDYFELVIRNAWHIPGGEGWCANTANLRVLVTHADGSQSVEMVEDDLGLSLPEDALEVLKRLRAQGVDAVAVTSAAGQTFTDDGAKQASWAKKYALAPLAPSRRRAAPRAGDDPRRGQVRGGPGPPPGDDGPRRRPRDGRPRARASARRSGARRSTRWRRVPLGLRDALPAGTQGVVDALRRHLKDTVFTFFDADRSAALDYAEFVACVRGPLSDRAAALVLAFDTLDVENAGAVSPGALAERFDAQAHPDGYYANLGAFETSETRFDALVGGVWHVSPSAAGGARARGGAAAAARARVRVTLANGHQKTHDLVDDGTLRDASGALDEREAVRRLQLVGVNGDRGLGGSARGDRAGAGARRARSLAAVERGLASPDYARALARPRTAPASPAPSNPFAPRPKSALDRIADAKLKTTLADNVAPMGPTSAPQTSGDGAAGAGVQLVAKRVAAELRKRGPRGFVALKRHLAAAADPGGYLTLAAFKSAIRDASVSVATDGELRRVFESVDGDSSGNATVGACVAALRLPHMSLPRANLVEVAFKRLDADGDGRVPPSKLAAIFDASQHPEVLAGRVSAQHAYDDFLASFDVKESACGEPYVGSDEFFDYHRCVSAAVGDDAYFKLLVRNVWRLEGVQSDEAMRDGEAFLTVVARRTDGRSSVEKLPASLHIAPDDSDALCAALRDHCGVSASSAFGVVDAGPTGVGDDGYGFVAGAALQRGGAADVAAKGAANVAAAAELISRKFEDRPRGRKMIGGAASRGGRRRFTGQPVVDVLKKGLDPGVKAIASRLHQDFVLSRGARGLVAFERRLRAKAAAVGGASSRHLTLEELSSVLREVDAHLSSAELRTLFATCDSDGDGTVDFADFVTLVRPPLSARRLALVQQAWVRAFGPDVAVVPPERVAAAFDAASHPEVLAGRQSANRAFSEFLDTFDVPEHKAASLAEFVTYHVNVGAAVSNDDYFDALVTRAGAKRTPDRVSASAGARFGDAYGVADALKAHDVGRLGARSHEAAAGIERLLYDLRTQLAAHGARGIVGLARKFRIVDDDGSKSINSLEFHKALKELGMASLTDSEQRLLFDHFDRDGSRSIDYEEFLRAVRPPMNGRRKDMARRAFAILDADGSGAIEPSEIASRYDASKHPDVLAGKSSAEDVYREFLETFDVGGDLDGKVTAQEFENYYENVSCSVDDDDYFELMMRNAWHIPGGDGWCGNSANLRVLVTRSDGSQAVECVEDDLGLSLPRDEKEILRRLRAQGVDAVAIEGSGGAKRSSAQKSASPKTFRGVVASRAAGGGTQQTDAYARSSGKKMQAGHGGMFGSQINIGETDAPPSPPAAHKKRSPNDVFHSVLGADMQEKPAPAYGPGASSPRAADGSLSRTLKKFDGQAVLKSVRAKLRFLGCRGIAGIARKFKIADDDNSGGISPVEFHKCMAETGLRLATDDVDALFALFDGDANGAISYDEFLLAVRGPMASRRVGLVDKAFGVLDRDKSGVVDVEDLVDAFDTSQHPEVIAGAKSSNEVLQEFLDTFEVGGEKDGKVTRGEFHNYYANVSASVDDDDYFELMIRNAWHIPGGEGWCANSANLHVLVTHQDGHQSVQMIEDDLGLDFTDTPHVLRKLQAQGIDAIDVRLYGAAGATKPKKNNTFRTTFTIE